jgi:hypothetical protein
MGISHHRLRKQPWFRGWNALLAEIGVQTNQFPTLRTPDEDVAAAVADLIVKLGRWPTEDEFAREKKANRKFPNVELIRRVKKSGRLWDLLRTYRAGDPAYSVVRSEAASRNDENEAADGQRP